MLTAVPLFKPGRGRSDNVWFTYQGWSIIDHLKGYEDIVTAIEGFYIIDIDERHGAYPTRLKDII